MKLRVGQMVGQIVEGMPWLGTFHSIGVKILRRHAELVGLKSNFTILDVDDQIRVIKMLLEAEKLDEKRWPARVFAMILDGWKNRGLTPDQVPAGEAAGFANGKGKKLYVAYQERLKTLNVAEYLWLRLLAQSSTSGGLILRDAALRAAPQDEEKGSTADETENPHPEERGRSPSVSKGEA